LEEFEKMEAKPRLQFKPWKKPPVEWTNDLDGLLQQAVLEAGSWDNWESVKYDPR
jgi:hypothetical protein